MTWHFDRTLDGGSQHQFDRYTPFRISPKYIPLLCDVETWKSSVYFKLVMHDANMRYNLVYSLLVPYVSITYRNKKSMEISASAVFVPFCFFGPAKLLTFDQILQKHTECVYGVITSFCVNSITKMQPNIQSTYFSRCFALFHSFTTKTNIFGLWVSRTCATKIENK